MILADTLIGPMKMLLCAVMMVPVPAQPRLNKIKIKQKNPIDELSEQLHALHCEIAFDLISSMAIA